MNSLLVSLYPESGLILNSEIRCIRNSRSSQIEFFMLAVHLIFSWNMRVLSNL